MKKLYIVIRQDLPHGLQAAQCCHALQAMNDQHPDTISAWEGNIVVLGAKDMAQLCEVYGRAQRACIPSAIFCEPDVGGEATAAAFHGDAGRGLSNLPLAMRLAS